MEITLAEQIKCVERELAMRQNVYGSWVRQGRMKKEKADHEIAAMTAILETLRAKQTEELAK